MNQLNADTRQADHENCTILCFPHNCKKAAAAERARHVGSVNLCSSSCTPQNCEATADKLIAAGRITDVGGGNYQSKIKYGYDKFDPLALKEVAVVLQRGAEIYGVNAWHGETTDHHVNHAIYHLYEYLAGELSEKHLVNAFCRVMFALGVDLRLEAASATKNSGMRFATEEVSDSGG